MILKLVNSNNLGIPIRIQRSCTVTIRCYLAGFNSYQTAKGQKKHLVEMGHLTQEILVELF